MKFKTVRPSNPDKEAPMTVGYGNGKWIVFPCPIGGGSAPVIYPPILSAPNGQDWFAETPKYKTGCFPAHTAIYDTVCGHAGWLIVGQGDGFAWRAIDGVTVEPILAPGVQAKDVEIDFAYYDLELKMYYFAWMGNLASSPDNVSYAVKQFSGVHITGMARHGSIWILATKQGVFKSSDNLQTIAPVNIGLPAGETALRVIYNGNVFVIVGSGKHSYSSTEAVIWAQHELPLNELYWQLRANGTTIYTMTQHGALYSSVDNGTTWQGIPFASGGIGTFGLAIHGDQMVIVNARGQIFYSDPTVTGSEPAPAPNPNPTPTPTPTPDLSGIAAQLGALKAELDIVRDSILLIQPNILAGVGLMVTEIANLLKGHIQQDIDGREATNDAVNQTLNNTEHIRMDIAEKRYSGSYKSGKFQTQ